MPADQLENPVSRERFTIRARGPEALVLEVRVPPDMIRPPAHLHRSQQESFQLLHGRITVQTGREQHVLGPGDRIAVPSAAPHTWWNSGEDEAVLLAEFRPPGQAQSFFETFCGMAAEGRCNSHGSPPFLQIAASARWWDSTWPDHPSPRSERSSPPSARSPGSAPATSASPSDNP